MSAITASEASYNTLAAEEPLQADLDEKYSIFNTVVKNAAAAGTWLCRVSVAKTNAIEFRTWAMNLGFSVLPSLTNADLAIDLDGRVLDERVRYIISWRKIVTISLRDLLSIHEGDQLAFDITAAGFQAGDEIYWRNTGTTRAEDFGQGSAILRPQGPWLTVKTAEQWAETNAAMKRLLTLRARATGNTALVARFDQQIAQLKQLLEYRAGLTQKTYPEVNSQYEGQLTFVQQENGDVTATINLLVVRDKGLEQATGLSEINETLIITLYADSEFTQLLKTSSTYTVVNEL